MIKIFRGLKDFIFGIDFSNSIADGFKEFNRLSGNSTIPPGEKNGEEQKAGEILNHLNHPAFLKHKEEYNSI